MVCLGARFAGCGLFYLCFVFDGRFVVVGLGIQLFSVLI